MNQQQIRDLVRFANGGGRGFGGRGGGGRGGRGFAFKPKQPSCLKNPLNLPAFERLQERMEAVQHNDNLSRSLAGAMSSLAASKDAVTTFKEALALKGVGNWIAGVMFPVKVNTDEAPVVVAKPGRAKKKKAAPTADADTATVAPKKTTAAKTSSSAASTGPSSKETNYQAAKKLAIDRWAHPIVSTTRISPAYGLMWKVLLLVDGREPESQHMLSKCSMSGIPAEERCLPIGDMTWVAQGLRKHRLDSGSTETTVEVELMLGTIIERKTTSDLVQSLFGTRYNEQRLRLKHSGQPQILFLIEGDIQKDAHSSFPKERLQMALMETRVYKGFQIINSKHLDDTVRTLKRFHRRILQRTFPQAFGIADDALPTFGSPDGRVNDSNPPNRRHRRRRPASLVEMVMDTPPVPAFGEARFMTYDELKCKIIRDREAGTRTVGALFGAMLRQVCGDKQTNAIRQSYPTPRALLEAYDELEGNVKEQEGLLANCMDTQNPDGAVRKVGPKISRDFYIACCTTPFPKTKSTTSTSSAVAKRPSPDRAPAGSDSEFEPTGPAKKKRQTTGKTTVSACLLAPSLPSAASISSSQSSNDSNNAKMPAAKSTVQAKSSQVYVELLSSDDEDDGGMASKILSSSLQQLDKENSMAINHCSRAQPIAASKSAPAAKSITNNDANSMLLLSPSGFLFSSDDDDDGKYSSQIKEQQPRAGKDDKVAARELRARAALKRMSGEGMEIQENKPISSKPIPPREFPSWKSDAESQSSQEEFDFGKAGYDVERGSKKVPTIPSESGTSATEVIEID